MNRLAVTLAAVAVALASVTVAAAGDEDEARESALAIYAERCGVEPGSARSRFARSDWDHLLAAATVESYRVQSSSAIDRERRRRSGADLRAGPGILLVRF